METSPSPGSAVPPWGRCAVRPILVPGLTAEVLGELGGGDPDPRAPLGGGCQRTGQRCSSVLAPWRTRACLPTGRVTDTVPQPSGDHERRYNGKLSSADLMKRRKVTKPRATMDKRGSSFSREAPRGQGWGGHTATRGDFTYVFKSTFPKSCC